jgi:hypothetical protein
LVLAGCFAGIATAQAEADYRATVLASPGLLGYWRLGEAAGTVVADQTGHVAGSYTGGVALGARGALGADSDTAALFDGTDDALEVGDASLALAGTGTIEGWIAYLHATVGLVSVIGCDQPGTDQACATRRGDRLSDCARGRFVGSRGWHRHARGHGRVRRAADFQRYRQLRLPEQRSVRVLRLVCDGSSDHP